VAIIKYTPSFIPANISLPLRSFLSTELRRISDFIRQSILFAEPLSSPPSKPENGVIAYAAGVNWHPGSGEGFYGFETGVWVKL
jgi:hypothetical protein